MGELGELLASRTSFWGELIILGESLGDLGESFERVERVVGRVGGVARRVG